MNSPESLITVFFVRVGSPNKISERIRNMIKDKITTVKIKQAKSSYIYYTKLIIHFIQSVFKFISINLIDRSMVFQASKA